jgi:serine/threonine protein kinase
MAPEITSNGGKYNEKSDIFSYGVLMYVIIEKRADPWRNKS